MQKKILLVIIISATAATVNAQIKKGTVFLGGQLGLYLQGTNEIMSNTTAIINNSFNVSPAFGKAIKENLIIGANIDFRYANYQTDFGYKQQSDTYGIGFFVRGYKNLSKDFYLFCQGRAGISNTDQKTTDNFQPDNNLEYKTNSFQLAIYPGVAYNVSKRLQLEVGLNNLGYVQYGNSKYEYPKNSMAQSSARNDFSAGSSLSNFSGLTIGFRVLLN